MRIKTLVMTLAVLLLAVPAMSDWNPGDPYKMHWPQLPDPFGWDVNATSPKVLADDWQCSETGPVSDVHLWGSWEFGQGEPFSITGIHLSIHTNIPASTAGGPSYSMPGELLWERDFSPAEFTVIDPWGTGDQGWYDPNTGEFRRPDHDLFHQINIVDIRDPFIQTRDEIYWLDVTVQTLDPVTRWGWKTSQDHFMDDAVWSDVVDSVGIIDDFDGLGWQELLDPETGESLDLAFVITPEPTTVSLMVIGGLAILRRRSWK